MGYKPLLILGGIAATPVAAATLNVTIPPIDTAEYHKPYVAIWLEPAAAGGAIRTLSVWYEVSKKGNEPGTKWLSDLRAWWRKGGKSLKMPADGVSGATRAPGTHSVTLPADLKPGKYVLNVEAARETGGREVVRMPIEVPVRRASSGGSLELGDITLSPK